VPVPREHPVERLLEKGERDVLLGREVVVGRPQRDLGAVRDVAHRGLPEALLPEQDEGHLQNAAAGLFLVVFAQGHGLRLKR
jgi:hypothetical protein